MQAPDVLGSNLLPLLVALLVASGAFGGGSADGCSVCVRVG